MALTDPALIPAFQYPGNQALMQAMLFGKCGYAYALAVEHGACLFCGVECGRFHGNPLRQMNDSDNTGTIVSNNTDGAPELTPYGERIRAIRNQRKLSQGEFAELAGVTVRAQRSYEAGLRTPNLDYLSALAAHGVDTRYIITGLKFSSAKDLLAPYAPAFHWLAETAGLNQKTCDKIAAIFDDASRYPSEGPDWGALQQISAENCIGQIDAALLASILSAIDDLAPSLPPRKKAGIASLLYRAFRASGQIDSRAVKDAVDLAS